MEGGIYSSENCREFREKFPKQKKNEAHGANHSEKISKISEKMADGIQGKNQKAKKRPPEKNIPTKKMAGKFVKQTGGLKS